MQLPGDIQTQLDAQARNLLTTARDSPFNRIREREFYSSYLFQPGMGGAIGAGQYDLFKVIKGLQGQGYQAPLTERETNWPQPNRIADDHNLLMTAIHCSIQRPPTDTTVYAAGVAATNPPTTAHVDLRIPLHPNDVIRCAFGIVLGITFLTNTVPYGFLGDFPEVGGVTGWNSAGRQIAAAAGAAVAAATTPAAANNRAFLPVFRNAVNPAFERRFAVPIFLKHGDTFSTQLIVPNTITLTDVAAVPGTNGESNDATGAVEIRIGHWSVESFIEHS